jgi:hypothetical protein
MMTFFNEIKDQGCKLLRKSFKKLIELKIKIALIETNMNFVGIF